MTTARRLRLEKLPTIVKSQQFEEWRATFERFVGCGGSPREAVGHMLFQAAVAIGLPPPNMWQWPLDHGLPRVASPAIIVQVHREQGSIVAQWLVARGEFVGSGTRPHSAAGDMFYGASAALGFGVPRSWTWPDGLNLGESL